jgi:hypothetical protein
MRHAWHCQNSATVSQTDMTISIHPSQKQWRSQNTGMMSVCMKQHMWNQLSHQPVLKLPTPADIIPATEVNLDKNEII